MNLSFSDYLVEGFSDKRLVVIYPGRFQPGHKGHFSVYKIMQEHFVTADVYIATSGSVSPPKSPFTFDEKKSLLELSGVPSDDIVQCKNPYLAHEILGKYPLNETRVIFCISQKDMQGPDARFSFKPKKDGSAPYFQPLTTPLTETRPVQLVSKLVTADKHAYIGVAPVTSFSVLGTPVKSASEIRNLYKLGDKAERKQIIRDLYSVDSPAVYELFNAKLG
jgi:hypothetical protein